MTIHVPQPKACGDVDRLVGLRITALRKARGLSQTALGQAVGVTFQQVQKYEKGQNRVGAGRLQEIARTLEVPVSSFYADEDGPDDPGLFGALAERGAIDLLHAYVSIKHPDVQRSTLDLVRAAAALAAKSASAESA